MQLKKIDFFSNGPLVVYQDYKISINHKSGCREDIPIDPVEIKSYEDLAKRVSRHDDIERLVDKQLEKSKELKAWRRAMPSKTPSAVAKYQRSPDSVDNQKVSDAIENVGFQLPSGQVLFHGGNLHGGRLNRTLSTTFCPQVARQEALWKGKAKKIGSVNIYKITITGDNVNGYVLKQKGTSLGNEKEVLISAGHELTVGNMIFEDTFGSDMPIRVFEANLK